ncbi:MAG: hypothetical protein QGG42_12500 [Phycisphaerae bacterium]|jgi:hypothetical protein|nr:hypothetical protein [Phycisphaerae bacterium]
MSYSYAWAAVVFQFIGLLMLAPLMFVSGYSDAGRGAGWIVAVILIVGGSLLRGLGRMLGHLEILTDGKTVKSEPRKLKSSEMRPKTKRRSMFGAAGVSVER